MSIFKVTCALIFLSSLTPAIAATLPTKPTKPPVYVTIGVQNGRSVIVSNGQILSDTFGFDDTKNYSNGGNRTSVQAPVNLPCTVSALCLNSSN